MRRGTYSVVARDAAAGQIGVAVQSHWFSVGSIVSWAQAGVGAVATQSLAEPAYGPRLLERLRGGQPPRDELVRLLDLHDAYELAGQADELAGSGRHEEAGERYRRALELAPDNTELVFWGGLARAQRGEVEEGVALVRRAIEGHPGWRE